jgi:WD40 repeat protein
VPINTPITSFDINRVSSTPQKLIACVGSLDGSVTVWDLVSKKSIFSFNKEVINPPPPSPSLQHPQLVLYRSRVNDVRWIPLSSTRLVAAFNDGHLVFLDYSKTEIYTPPLSKPLESAQPPPSVMPQLRFVFCSTKQGLKRQPNIPVAHWQDRSLKCALLTQLSTHNIVYRRNTRPPSDPSAMALSPDGSYIAVGCKDGSVRILHYHQERHPPPPARV